MVDKNRWDQYDTTAANNTDIDGASLVDTVQTVDALDTIFQNIMQDTAQWLADNNGSNSTAGSSNAYTYAASAQTFTAYFTGLTLTLQANHTNTSAATLNVDSVGAKAVRKYVNGAEAALVGGELLSAAPFTVIYDADANSSAGAWILQNPVFPGQLKFPATQVASSDANTLDDYEEGTFTPGISFGGGTTGITYSTQSGSYTKIGNRVFFELRITLTAKGSSTGTARVTGLPFAIGGGAGLPSFTAGESSGFTLVAGLAGGLGDSGATTATLEQDRTTGTSVINETHFVPTTTLFLSGSYEV